MKTCKDRVTLMACLNATGTCKLPLLVIGKLHGLRINCNELQFLQNMITVFVGKSAKPRCFKNMNMDALPVK